MGKKKTQALLIGIISFPQTPFVCQLTRFSKEWMCDRDPPSTDGYPSLDGNYWCLKTSFSNIQHRWGDGLKGFYRVRTRTACWLLCLFYALVLLRWPLQAKIFTSNIKGASFTSNPSVLCLELWTYCPSWLFRIYNIFIYIIYIVIITIIIKTLRCRLLELARNSQGSS